jgi:hypothetical protein
MVTDDTAGSLEEGGGSVSVCAARVRAAERRLYTHLSIIFFISRSFSNVPCRPV